MSIFQHLCRPFILVVNRISHRSVVLPPFFWVGRHQDHLDASGSRKEDGFKRTPAPYSHTISEAPGHDSVQLVPITPISLWFMDVYGTQITNYSIPGANLNQRSHHWGGLTLYSINQQGF